MKRTYELRSASNCSKQSTIGKQSSNDNQPRLKKAKPSIELEQGSSVQSEVSTVTGNSTLSTTGKGARKKTSVEKEEVGTSIRLRFL